MHHPLPRKRFPPLVLLAAPVLAGCPVASIYQPDVRLNVSVHPAVLLGGETARLELTLTNPGPDSVVLEFGGTHCRVTFMILPPDPRAPGADLCASREAGRVALAAGGAWRTGHAWRPATAEGAPLPAGEYRVRAVLGEHDSVVRGKRDFKLGHSSDTVAIRVLPPGGE